MAKALLQYRLESLHLENFTAFGDAEFKFGKNLNVIVGENGTGKTHVLKAAYTAVSINEQTHKIDPIRGLTKAQLQIAIADKLIGVFKPDQLGRLVTRVHGNARCNVHWTWYRLAQSYGFSFHTRSKSEVTLDTQIPHSYVQYKPVFLPARELLTIYPGFVSLYETTELPFDETWRDTCILLGAPLAKGPRIKDVKELLTPLEDAMGGSIELTGAGQFYLRTSTGSMEMHLVAEGLRKLAMIARLIATGSLLSMGYLFWDEPEANLNPATVRVVAKTIMDLSKNGIQVFIATHSLYLMRELYLLQMDANYNALDVRCFGLHRNGSVVSVQQGSTIDDIGDISSLDAELEQSQRYLEAEVI